MSDNKLKAYQDPNNPGNSEKYHTGELCVEGCGRPAGTAWSPHWCFECNVARIEKITRQLEAFEMRIKCKEDRKNGKTPNRTME